MELALLHSISPIYFFHSISFFYAFSFLLLFVPQYLYLIRFTYSYLLFSCCYIPLFYLLIISIRHLILFTSFIPIYISSLHPPLSLLLDTSPSIPPFLSNKKRANIPFCLLKTRCSINKKVAIRLHLKFYSPCQFLKNFRNNFFLFQIKY